MLSKMLNKLLLIELPLDRASTKLEPLDSLEISSY